MTRFFISFICCIICLSNIYAQNIVENTDSISFLQVEEISAAEEFIPETLPLNPQYPRTPYNPYKFKAKQLIVPAALITVGSIGLTHWWKKDINEPIRHALQKDHHKKLPFDDYIQYAPAVVGYGMNLFGIKGMHNIADATIIYATAYLLLAATSIPLKSIIKSPRPNGHNNKSFPSGHTATVFTGAQLLCREYWNVSPWIGVAGYIVATGTGFMRMYNNAHWFNDVIAGAGLGILCAEAAYWLYPVITKGLFKKRYNANVFLSPSISTTQVGMACSISL